MTNWYHGQGNSGPAREVWCLGDRVRHIREPGDGTVARSPREPNASQVLCVWVIWDDGDQGFVDPNMLDAA